MGPCVHIVFVSSEAPVYCFVLVAKLLLQNGVWRGEMEQLCTQSHIGYSRCENNNILCRYPGTRSRAASETPPYTEENSFATLALLSSTSFI